MPRKNRSIVAVETNPPEYVDFRVRDGTLRSLKVYVGHAEDLGKLFVQCDLCGTFISLGAKRSPMNMEKHRDKASCRDQRKRRERESKINQQEAAVNNLFREPGMSRMPVVSECQ
jgi:hypothetical protein